MNTRYSVAIRALVLSALLVTLSVTASADVQVALVPSSTNIDPNTEFEVRIEVTPAGDPFNAYEAHVEFDPSALTFLQATPLTLQEGQAMTSACGSRFHLFDSNGSTLSISHALLCPNVSISGGELYVLRFRSAATTQSTQIVFSSIDFAAAGASVSVGATTSTTIQIGNATDAPPSAREAVAPHIAAWPNPFNPETAISVDSPFTGRQSLNVYDARGRLVDVLQNGIFEAGTRIVRWNGRSSNGEALACGVYTLVLRTGGWTTTHRVVLLK